MLLCGRADELHYDVLMSKFVLNIHSKDQHETSTFPSASAAADYAAQEYRLQPEQRHLLLTEGGITCDKQFYIEIIEEK